jgi:peptidyl-prolyl cis-trans isomerase B (cyclophilin B)
MMHSVIEEQMRFFFILGLVACLFGCQTQSKETTKIMANPTVTIRTTLGEIQLELFEDKAPVTVKNFLRYVDEKHYHQTIFHRVIDGFMIQGGGMTSDMKQKTTHEPIHNEADNRLANKRGTIAMARTSEVHSSTAQFFINVVDNNFLDYRNPTPTGYGYCVFGQVTSGMEIVDKIKNAKTTIKKGLQDVPADTIEIKEIVRNQ